MIRIKYLIVLDACGVFATVAHADITAFDAINAAAIRLVISRT